MKVSPIEGEKDIKEISYVLNELREKRKIETVPDRKFFFKIKRNIMVCEKPEWVEFNQKYFSKVEIQENNKKTIIKE